MSGQFRQLARLLALIAVVGVTINHAVHAEEHGRVEGLILADQGKPISNALVVVSGTRFRLPNTVPCSTCSTNCGKLTRTDAEGRFALTPVSTELFYQLLVIAEGFAPEYIKDADPLFGSVQVLLKPRENKGAAMTNVVNGRVVGPRGQPLVGVSVSGIASSSSNSMSVGPVLDGDALSVTDERGNFQIRCGEEVLAMAADFRACGYAERKMWMDTGKTYLVRLNAGVTVAGRIVKDGKALADVPVALRSTQGNNLGIQMLTRTGENGDFNFLFAPPATDIRLQTVMSGSQGKGIWLAPVSITTGPDHSLTNVGNLAVQDAHNIQGRIVLDDGGAIPRRAMIRLGIEETSDFQTVGVAEDGAFEFVAVPPTAVVLDFLVGSYQPSWKNPNRHPYKPGQLAGVLDRNLTNFIVHLQRRVGTAIGLPEQVNRGDPSNLPLRGVPP